MLCSGSVVIPPVFRCCPAAAHLPVDLSVQPHSPADPQLSFLWLYTYMLLFYRGTPNPLTHMSSPWFTVCFLLSSKAEAVSSSA